jgi:limonene-1,2-epoxide hydrolase
MSGEYLIARVKEFMDSTEHEKSGMLEPLTVERIRELWTQTYNQKGKPDWSHLFPYYHENIIFQDSIQRVEGIEEFTAMCNRLAKRSEQLNMEILSIIMDANEVFFQWKMLIMFKKFPSTALYGCTALTLGDDNRIIYQRDYFDIWGTILNGIPILRSGYWKFMRKYFG